MASGLGVVAYDYAAARSHIVDGATGILVPFGDSKAFVASALGIARQPAQVARIGRQAREYSASLDWSRVVDKFESLLSGNSENAQGSIGSMIGQGNLAIAARRT